MHLFRRFISSLFARPLGFDEFAFVFAHLNEPERAVWSRYSRADQQHTYGVARKVASEPVVQDWMITAALLHDIGKVECKLGTFMRAITTIVYKTLGRAKVTQWRDRGGVRGQMGIYVDHPAGGAALLSSTETESRVVTWVAQHHLPRERWTLPLDQAEILWRHDND